MFKSIRLGRLWGTAVYLHPLWFLALVLFVLPSLMAGDTIGTMVSFVIMIGLYGSVMLHEYAHIFTARAFGIRTPRVTMHLFGGLAQLARMPWGLPESIIAVAGPIFSFAFGFLLMQFDNPIFKYVGGMNYLLAVFNMLPILPLDGGRVVRGIMYAVTNRLVLSTKVVTYGGLFVVLPLTFTYLLPLTFWTAVLAFLIVMMSIGEMEHIENTHSDTRRSEDEPGRTKDSV